MISIKWQFVNHFIEEKFAKLFRPVFLKIYKKSTLSAAKHQEKIKQVNFSLIKGPKEAEKSSKGVRWAAKMFISIFGGPQCFQSWEPLSRQPKKLQLRVINFIFDKLIHQLQK